MDKEQKASSDRRVMETHGFFGFNWKAAAIKKADAICARIDKRKAEGTRQLLEIGRDLGELRAMCQRGEFIPAVEVRLGMNRSTALKAIQAYERFGNADRCPHLENFDSTAVRLLSAKSTDELVFNRALEVASSGERVTEVLVKDWISQLRKPERKPSKTVVIEGEFSAMDEIDVHYNFFKGLPKDVLALEIANLINDAGLSIEEIARLVCAPVSEVE
jgi:hypothetical protein